MGDEELSNDYRAKLERDFNDTESRLIGTIELYNKILLNYNETMNYLINRNEYLSPSDLQDGHQNAKAETVKQVCLYRIN